MEIEKMASRPPENQHYKVEKPYKNHFVSICVIFVYKEYVVTWRHDNPYLLVEFDKNAAIVKEIYNDDRSK